jgi:hypothetical protein
MRVKTGGAGVGEYFVVGCMFFLVPPFLHLLAQDLFGVSAFLFGVVGPGRIHDIGKRAPDCGRNGTGKGHKAASGFFAAFAPCDKRGRGLASDSFRQLAE